MDTLYKKMYLVLFNAITDALRALETGNIWDARNGLIAAQCNAEEMYISSEDTEDRENIVEIFVENVEK